MKTNISEKYLNVSGMTCVGCETRIEKRLTKLNGVIKVKANFATAKLNITYDTGKVNVQRITEVVTDMGYKCSEGKIKEDTVKNTFNAKQVSYIFLIIIGLFLLVERIGGLDFFNYFPQAKAGMNYAGLFVVGLLTSVHCLAMCGGLNLSQSVSGVTGEGSAQKLIPSLLYNLGRVISYTVIGGLVGALGSVMGFSKEAGAAVAIFAGVFMIIMGLNMLNIFPWLRKISPRLPKFLTGNSATKSKAPLYVGLLNGLMPCGPLQAMQLYALSTGSVTEGALSMLIFALGTVPLMFGFGALTAFISKKFTAKVMSVCAVIVVLFGVGMFNNGLGLIGVNFGANNPVASDSDIPINIENGVQTVSIDVSKRGYAPITVKKGIPVKWIINAKEENLNGCNYEIYIPKYDLSKVLEPGENIVEFTPEETGVIPYSCWMGMIRSKINVIE